MLLLGVVGFLWFERMKLDKFAGMALVLAAIKPQLLYLFGLAALVWAVDQQRWRILLGGGCGAAAAIGIALCFDPQLLTEYRYALSHPPADNITPTVGAMLRLTFGPRDQWLQYLPTLFGVAWFAWYWRRERLEWNWGDQAPILLLMSFLTTAYGAWVFDLVVLLVPVLHIAACTAVQHTNGRWRIAAVVYTSINVVALAMNLTGASYPAFIWMTPAILLAYLAFRRRLAGAPVPALT
jgi:hypothetical protein